MPAQQASLLSAIDAGINIRPDWTAIRAIGRPTDWDKPYWIALYDFSQASVSEGYQHS